MLLEIARKTTCPSLFYLKRIHIFTPVRSCQTKLLVCSHPILEQQHFKHVLSVKTQVIHLNNFQPASIDLSQGENDNSMKKKKKKEDSAFYECTKDDI